MEELAGPRGFSAATAEALAHGVARTRLRRAIESHEAEAVAELVLAAGAAGQADHPGHHRA